MVIINFLTLFLVVVYLIADVTLPKNAIGTN